MTYLDTSDIVQIVASFTTFTDVDVISDADAILFYPDTKKLQYTNN